MNITREKVHSFGYNYESAFFQIYQSVLRDVEKVSSYMVGRNSSAGIVTCYGLNGSGIEYRWGQNFSHLSRPVLGPTQPIIQWTQGLFPRTKRPRCCFNHLPPSSAEVKERVEL